MTEKEFVTVGKGEDKHPIPVDYMKKDEYRQYAGLDIDEYNELGRKYQEIKSKDHLSPSDVKESISILDKYKEGYNFDLRHEKSEVSKKSIQEILKGIEKQQNQLKDWFNTSKNKPKFYNKEWKEYYNKHKEEFKTVNNEIYISQSERLKLGNKY